MFSPVGHKQRVDSNSMIGLNDNLIEMESAKKMEEYTNNERMLEIWDLCELKKVCKFNYALKKKKVNRFKMCYGCFILIRITFWMVEDIRSLYSFVFLVVL